MAESAQCHMRASGQGKRQEVGRSLTTFSQTERTAPDSGAQPGLPVDTDLRIRILAHWADGWHWSMDQKAGDSSPSERAPPSAPAKPHVRTLPRGNGRGPEPLSGGLNSHNFSQL